jgi:hypothetical protein
MTPEQWNEIENEMRELYAKDNALTHFDITINIKEVYIEPKRARINIKTFKDKNYESRN